jgi:hypothetical protein
MNTNKNAMINPRDNPVSNISSLNIIEIKTDTTVGMKIENCIDELSGAFFIADGFNCRSI